VPTEEEEGWVLQLPRWSQAVTCRAPTGWGDVSIARSLGRPGAWRLLPLFCTFGQQRERKREGAREREETEGERRRELGAGRRRGSSAAWPCSGGAELGCRTEVYQWRPIGRDERGGGFGKRG
jgi:hypothetical protein